MKGFSLSDLRRPADYKARYERAEHQRARLSDQVKRLEMERDAYRMRLQDAAAEIERLKAAACPPRTAQARLGTGA
ncbi:hypothetical protein SAMN04488503_2225 [Humidesulfovibrio mexicanus]|uniref:Uncharacterized protein n=1 Tax=Humidesulfovibrio mexicanus TaxID=147047 RepID=A0A239AUI1_9BACT|nr:hypothetical protein [Humidesulfovibrio mexicanus]SNR99179.1 hypothetical protein SAMN04488503_2225 [Humidesulfovibrio mexicanus]